MEKQKTHNDSGRAFITILKFFLCIFLFTQYVLLISKISLSEENIQNYYRSAIPTVDTSLYVNELSEVGLSVEQANAILNDKEVKEIAVSIATEKTNALLGRIDKFKTTSYSAQIQIRGIIDRHIEKNGKIGANTSEKQVILLMDISGISKLLSPDVYLYQTIQYSTLFDTTVTPIQAKEIASILNTMFAPQPNTVLIVVVFLFYLLLFGLSQGKIPLFCKSVGQTLGTTSVFVLALVINSLRVNQHTIFTYGLTVGMWAAGCMFVLSLVIQFIIPYLYLKHKKETKAEQIYNQQKKETR